MIFNNGYLTQEAIVELNKHTDLIECECPTYLINILAKVREFNAYTTECIKKYPDDAATHAWLQTSARNIDAMLSNTIVQLARMEGFINEENEITSRQKK